MGDGHPEPLVDAAVPLGVALGEVVVDRDEVDALAEGAAVEALDRRERVQVEREARDEGLALAGLHLGDVALVEDDPAHHLDVEHALVGLAQARLADGGERLEEELVRGPRRSRAAARNSAVFARSSSSESAWNSGSSVAMYAACSCEPLHAPAFAEAEEPLEARGSRSSC